MNGLHLAWKLLGYLSLDIICSKKQTVFRERSSRKTVGLEEQKMSKDNYPSIFLPQMEDIVLIILQNISTMCIIVESIDLSEVMRADNKG